MRRNILPIQFLSKENVFFPALNSLCSSENLCDVKVICQGGKTVFMHRAVLRICFTELIDQFPSEDPTVILLPDEEFSHVEEARRKLYLNGNQSDFRRVLQAPVPVFCKEENIFSKESDMSCDTLDTNNANEELNGDNDDQVSNDIHSTQMSNEIQALLEQKAKRELGGRRDNVGDVKFCFLNTKLKPHSRSWRPELGNLVTHEKYTFHLNQLVKNAKRQSWTCRLGKVIFRKKNTSC